MSQIQNQANPTGTLAVNNVGADGTTLTGSCGVTNDTFGAFSIVGDNNFSVLKGDPADTITVACNATFAVDTYLATLACIPDGLAPENFNLVCNITDGPQPVFGSDPATGSTINMAAEYEGDPIDDATVEIDNDNGQTAGDLVSELISTSACAMTGDTGVISISSGGSFSILAGGPHAFVTVSCDSSVTGSYQATMTCPHNAAGSPATYNFACEVGPKEPAVFDSTPVAGTETDMTPGDVKTGDDIADQDLVLRNIVQANGADMEIDCGFDGDSGGITATPLGTNVLAPGEATTVTFSCDNTTAADSQAVYSCDWRSVDDRLPAGVPGATVSYTYICDVRDAEVNVVSTPPDGSTLTEQVPGGGSATFNVVFGVEVDEGVDGELLDCTLDDDVNFTILSPDFPAAIPSDGTLTVSVQGNDPGGVDELQTVLRCIYEDSNTPDGGEEWTYNLVMEIGSFATFRVTKDFTDGNPADVRVELNCNHGLPLNQGFNISIDQDVNFVLGSFADGEPDCWVTEVGMEGYETTYHAFGDQGNPSFDADGCYFDNVGRGDVYICNITNEPMPVEIDITKEWVIEGAGGNVLDLEARIEIVSTAEVEGSHPCRGNQWCRKVTFDKGYDSETKTLWVDTSFEGTVITLEEDLLDSSFIADNDCGGELTVYPKGHEGDDANDQCTFTNTVFFEGIPTLNQYGLALLALLMLGVGMIGFRRFS